VITRLANAKKKKGWKEGAVKSCDVMTNSQSIKKMAGAAQPRGLFEDATNMKHLQAGD